MNKQKFFRILSILGGIFTVFIVSSYAYTIKNRGDVIENKIEVPKDFARQFNRVLTRERYLPMEKSTFLSPEGDRMNWQLFEGKYLLVNFWATWCPPCVLELPSLDKLRQKMKDENIEIIAISLDTMRGHDDIRAFLDNRGIGDFAAYLDDAQEIKKNIYMRGLPTTYLLSPEGEVMYIFEGDAKWDSTPGINFFKMLLNAQST